MDRLRVSHNKITRIITNADFRNSSFPLYRERLNCFSSYSFIMKDLTPQSSRFS